MYCALQGIPNLGSLPSYIKSSRSVCEFKININNFKDIDCGHLIM